MRIISAIACWLAVAGVCLAGDVVFTNADFQNKPQQVRSAFVYYLDGPTLTGSNNITRDRVDFKTDLGGYFVITNYYPGNYRIELQGTKTTTTNWFEFPATNGTINGTDVEWSRGPTNSIALALTSSGADHRYLRIPTNSGAAGQVPSWTSANSTEWKTISSSGFVGNGNQFAGSSTISIKDGAAQTNVNLWGTIGINSAFLTNGIQVDGVSYQTIDGQNNLRGTTLSNYSAFGVDVIGNVAGLTFSGDGSQLTGLNASHLTTGTVPFARLGISNVVIQVFTNGTVIAPWGLVDTTGTKTAGIQEAIDSMPRKTDIFHGAGGGTIVLSSGFFNCSTGIVIPNTWPFALTLKGGGIQSTYIRYQDGGTATNTALLRAQTNNVIFGGLTNMLTLLCEDLAFTSDNLFATNALVNLFGENFAEFNRCLFASTYALTNGNGGYTTSFEANVPNAPAGLVGLILNPDADGKNDANAKVLNCKFYGLANGMWASTATLTIQNNYFACCGIYNSTPPPTVTIANIHYCTNLWRGDVNNRPYLAGMSVGFAIAVDTTDVIIMNNEFFACGAAVFNDPLQGSAVEPIRLINNRYSSVQNRVVNYDIGALAICIESGPGGGVPQPIDSTLNNTASAVFPTGSPLVSYPVLSYKLDAENAEYVFSGGALVGDASGLTGANATTLFSSGTVPAARLPNINGINSPGTVVTQGNSFAVTVSNAWRIDKTHALVASNVTASTIAGFDAANQLTNITVGSGLSLSAGLVLTASGSAGSDSSAWHNGGDTYTGASVGIGPTNGNAFNFLMNENGGINATVGAINTAANNPTVSFQIGQSNSVGAGFDNMVLGNHQTVSSIMTEVSIMGGSYNTINGSGNQGFVSGGKSNLVSGQYSWAGGYRAKAAHTGAFTWADSTEADFTSLANNTFNVRASAGNIWTASHAYATNSTGTKPDFTKAYTLVTTNASFTVLLPSGVDTTKTLDQMTTFYVTNSGNSSVSITGPANVHQLGTWTLNAQGLTKIVFECHGGTGFTNATSTQIY